MSGYQQLPDDNQYNPYQPQQPQQQAPPAYQQTAAAVPPQQYQQQGYPQQQQSYQQQSYAQPQQQQYAQPRPQQYQQQPYQQQPYQQQPYQQQPYQQQPYQQQYHPPQPNTVVIVSNLDYGNPTPEMARAKHIMTHGLFGCLDDGEGAMYFVASWFFPACVFGYNYCSSNQMEGAGGFCIGLCCYPFLCGASRSYIQRISAAPDDGCPLNCLLHLFCRPCSLAQEARAIETLKRSQPRHTAPAMAMAPSHAAAPIVVQPAYPQPQQQAHTSITVVSPQQAPPAVYQ